MSPCYLIVRTSTSIKMCTRSVSLCAIIINNVLVFTTKVSKYSTFYCILQFQKCVDNVFGIEDVENASMTLQCRVVSYLCFLHTCLKCVEWENLFQANGMKWNPKHVIATQIVSLVVKIQCLIQPCIHCLCYWKESSLISNRLGVWPN